MTPTTRDTMAGRFISFEGGEGTGKTTQVALLADALRARGHTVVTTREPGGTPGGEAVRALLLEGGRDRWEPRAEALLFAAARADHVARVIRPALGAGAMVLCDRFVDSSRVYQGHRAGGWDAGAASDADAPLDDAAIMALHAIGSRGLLPDLTIVLTLPATAALARVGARGREDRIGRRALAEHDALQHRFLALAAADPARFRTIDADASSAVVHDRVLAVLDASRRA